MSRTDLGRTSGGMGAPAPRVAAAARWWPPGVVFFVLALLVAGALGALQPVTHLDPQVLSLPQFGPAVAAVVVLVAFPSLRPTVAATFGGPVGAAVRQLALVGLTAAAIAGGCVGVCVLLGRTAVTLSTADLVAPLAVVVAAQLVGACGEELGWRALLLPLLGRRLSPLVASAVVGVLWGVWHVQVFTVGAAFAVAFLLSAVALSVVMGLAIRRAGGHNLVIAGTFHLLANLVLLFLLDEEDGDPTAMWTFALTAAVLAAVWTLADRRCPDRRLRGL